MNAVQESNVYAYLKRVLLEKELYDSDIMNLIISLCKLDLTKMDPNAALSVSELINRFLSKLKIRIGRDYEISFLAMKDCLKNLKDVVKLDQYLAIFYNVITKKCVKIELYDKIHDIRCLFAKHFLDLKNVPSVQEIKEIKRVVEEELWNKLGFLESKIATVEMGMKKDSELSHVIVNLLEDLTLEIDSIDEKIYELGILEKIIESNQFLESDYFRILKEEDMESIIVLDKYLTVVISAKKLVENIKATISKDEMLNLVKEILKLSESKSDSAL